MRQRIIICGALLFMAWGLLRPSARSSVQLENRLQPPSGSHWLGSDDLGRDLGMRVLEGCCLSLAISLLAWIASLAIGLFLGSLAGYYANTWLGKTISTIISAVYIIPFTVFLIALLAVLGPGLSSAYFILVLLAWAAPARQTRSLVMRLRHAATVTTARSFGYSTGLLLRRIMIPQTLPTVLIGSLAVLPEIIALDAGLCFLGLGAPPPTPTLGKLLADGISYLTIAWWMSLFPILALMMICWLVRLCCSVWTPRADGSGKMAVLKA